MTVTTVASSLTTDATLTTTYAVPLTGLTIGGQSRLMTTAEIAAFPVDLGFRSAIQRQSGLGWICTLGGFGGTGIIDGNSIWPRLPQRMIRMQTDGPTVEVEVFAQANSSFQVFVDGAPVSAQVCTAPVAVGASFLHIAFDSAATRLVEVRTDCYVGRVATGAGHTVTKPAAKTGHRVLVIGESVTQPVIFDGVTGSSALFGLAHWQRMVAALWGEVADMQVEGVGGTSFFTRQSGSYGGGLNNFLDRVAGHISYAPTVLVVATAWSDDYAAGVALAQSVSNADAYVQAVQAALPGCQIVFSEGLRAPAFPDPSADYAARTSAMRALHADLDWIRPAGWIGLGGYRPGHETGTGTSDLYTGEDALHPTVEGHNHYFDEYLPIMQDILADTTGSLRNIILTQPVGGSTVTAAPGTLYGHFLMKALNKEVDFDTDTVKAMLVSSAYTPDQDAHTYKSDITSEIAGTGYVAGGVALTTKTVTYDAAANTITLDADDPGWNPSTISGARYMIVYVSTGVDATSPLVCWIDFGSDKGDTDGNFQVQLPSGLVVINIS